MYSMSTIGCCRKHLVVTVSAARAEGTFPAADKRRKPGPPLDSRPAGPGERGESLAATTRPNAPTLVITQFLLPSIVMLYVAVDCRLSVLVWFGQHADERVDDIHTVGVGADLGRSAARLSRSLQRIGVLHRLAALVNFSLSSGVVPLTSFVSRH